MSPGELLEALGTIGDAPEGIERLRQLVLQLAVRGRLVPQDPEDGSAVNLLETLPARRRRMIEEGVIIKPRSTRPEGDPPAPYDIPDQWSWTYLGEVGAIAGGGTPKSGTAEYWADGHAIPWLTPADMRQQPSRNIERGSRDITEDGLANSSARIVPAGTVLFSSRAPIGHVGIAAAPLSTNQGFKSCVPYHTEMSEFIYWFLKKIGPEVNETAEGTTFKEVSGTDVAAFRIPLPPLAEQRRIVAKVDELMALLDELERTRDERDARRAAFRDSALAALQNAEDAEAAHAAWSRIATNLADCITDPADIAPLRQTILQLAVRGRLVPYSESVSCAFGDVVEIYSGCAFKSEWYQRDGGIRCVRNQNIGHGELDWSDTVHIPQTRRDEFARFELADGDLVLSLNRPFISTGLKLSWIRDTDLPCLLVQRVARLRPDSNRLLPEYLYLWCVAPHFYRNAHVVPSSGVPYISPKRVAAMPLELPSLAKQRRIIAKVDELMAICDELEQRLTEAKTHQSAFAAAAVHHLDLESNPRCESEATVTALL